MNRAMITTEERALVKDAIILTYIMDILDLERTKVSNGMNLLQNLQSEVMEAVFDRARLELIGIKRQLKDMGIKYDNGVNQEFIMEFVIWCRGYRNVFHLTRDHAKSEVGVKMGKLSGEIEAKLRAAR